MHGERLLAVDLAIARRWGQLSAALGHDSADLLIAATALEQGLTVVTRNLRLPPHRCSHAQPLTGQRRGLTAHLSPGPRPWPQAV